MMQIGDTFVAPGGHQARFRQGRPMQVINVMTLGGDVWVDAQPVEPRPGDEYWHQTYRFEELMEPVPLGSEALAPGGVAAPVAAVLAPAAQRGPR